MVWGCLLVEVGAGGGGWGNLNGKKGKTGSGNKETMSNVGKGGWELTDTRKQSKNQDSQTPVA
jgi:hypothetical protein